MQTALAVLKMAANRQETLAVEELPRLLETTEYNARAWALAVCGNTREVPISALLAQVSWVPYDKALESLPLKLHGQARRRRVWYSYAGVVYSFIHIRDLLVLWKQHRGTLRCLNHLLSERPERDPVTGRRVSWGTRRTSVNF